MRIKPLDASRIIDIPLKDWKDVGDNAANVVRDQIKNKRAIKGSYDPSYAVAKKNRKAARSQASTETSFVDLTLTGRSPITDSIISFRITSILSFILF